MQCGTHTVALFEAYNHRENSVNNVLVMSMLLSCLRPILVLVGPDLAPPSSGADVPRQAAHGVRRVAAHAPSKEKGCQCANVREQGGWCGVCKIGYVAAVRIESAALFHAIDAHGHNINPESFRCATCRKMIASDGFCASCRTGFAQGQAYFSRITYLLAKGTVRSAATISCATCKAHVGKPAWCEPCGVGMVGHVAFTDKEMFSRAKVAYDGLLAAVAKVPTCLSCAVAIAVDRSCRRCKKSYLHGKLVVSKKASP